MRKASRIEFCFGLVKFEMLFRSSGRILSLELSGEMREEEV